MNDNSMLSDLRLLGIGIGRWCLAGFGTLREGIREGIRQRIHEELQVLAEEEDEEDYEPQPAPNGRLPQQQPAPGGYLPPVGEQSRQKRPHRKQHAALPQQSPQLPGGQQ